MKEEVVIKINNIDDIFNIFDDNDITDELANYIENRCSRILKKEMIIKIITEEKLDNEIKDKVVNAVRTHYGLETKHTLLDNRRTNYVNFLLLCLGILIIVIESILKVFDSLLNIIDIIGGFMIWESAYNLLFTDSEMDRKVDRAKKIINSKIVFEVEKK